ncbi:hypothetical protein HKCCE3408_00940 [Rhodobacterales bacterium HKCCE3408]|nr:hypothetical protein [Rhodobacterales bacterium HKCCE3408]
MRSLGEFRSSEEGGILVFASMCLIAFIAMAAITFDLGRLAATQGDLQSYVDHVALAAAGELDGRDDSITRATLAASTLIRDRQSFADGDQALGTNADYSLRFLNGLPDDDTASVTPFVTTDPIEAAYVEVTATPRSVTVPFARALATLLDGDGPNQTVGAVAIAGYTMYACDITPLMFCVPDSGFDADEHVGDTVLLRSGGQGAAWGPGDFGFLDPSRIEVDPNGPCAGLSGVRQDACLIAAHGNITQCFAQRGVDTEPGQKVGIENSIFNSRFDIYTGIMSGLRNNPAYAPGPHVVSGLIPGGGGGNGNGGGGGNGNGGGGNICLGQNAAASPDTMAFPPDDCFATGTCPEGSGRFGDGGWSAGRALYVNTNHGGIDPDMTAETRYELYLREIELAGGAGSSQPILSGLSETGRPQCASSMVPEPERRVFIAAAIDCVANPINGAETGVPVHQFVEVFLMRPVGDSTQSPPVFDLWVEIIGSAGGDGAGAGVTESVFHENVELVR